MIESTKSTKRLVWRWGFWALGVAVLASALMAGIETVRADEAPTLPAYFTATNDPAKPSWPDPTGAASGVWAAPAGDGKGDVPSSLDIAGLYDRVTHNLYLDQLRLGAGHRLPGHVHAGRLHVRRDRALPSEERRAHGSHEFHDLSARVPGLLGLRFRDRLGQLVERPGAARVVSVARSRALRLERRCRSRGGGRRRRQCHRRLHLRPHGHQGILLERLGERRRRDGPLLFHDGVHGHHRHDSDRRHGRALGVEELPALRSLGRPAVLPLRQLGVGWRLARPGRPQLGAWARCGGFRGVGCRARDGRNHRPRRRDGDRSAHREVRLQGQTAGISRAQHPDGGARHVHPRVRVVRVQSRLDARRHRSAHQLRRREHAARQHHRRARRAPGA